MQACSWRAEDPAKTAMVTRGACHPSYLVIRFSFRIESHMRASGAAREV